MELPKKRVRVPSSCTVCRRRKIKCNKTRPSCDQCTAVGLPHLCQYEDPGWMNMTTDSVSGSAIVHDASSRLSHTAVAGSQPGDLLARIRELERRAVAGTSSLPLYFTNEKVNMLDNLPFLIPTVLRSSTIELHGCMSPVTDIKTDPYLKVAWLHIWKYLDLAMQNRTSTPSEDTPVNFKTRALTSAISDFLKLRRQKLAFETTCEKLNNPAVSLETKLLEHIPPKRTILYLLDIYFTELYPLIPVVQQHAFLHEDMERILGGWVNQHAKPTKLNLTTPYDYGYIGVLFALMACSALTLRDKDIDKISELKSLKKLRPAIFAKLAYMCIDTEKVLRNASSLKFGLVLVLLKFYYNHCPEDDATSDSSQERINVGVILSIFRANGLHCDPSQSLSPIFTNPKKLHVYWRRVWHTLMSIDASDAALAGLLPRFMDDSSYDTKVPDYEVGMPEMEISVIHDFKFLEKRTDLYRRLAVTLFQRKNDPTIGQVLDFADELRDFAKDELVSFEYLLKKNTEPYARVKQVAYLLQLNGLEAGLRQRAISYFHDSKNKKLEHEHFSKQLTLLARMLNTSLNICYNIDRYFGTTFAFFARGTLLFVSARVMMSLSALMGRCSQSIRVTPMQNQSRLRSLRELQSVVLLNMDRALQLISKVNIGFYNAQRSNVILSFLLALLKDPAFDFEKARDDVASRGASAAENGFHDLRSAMDAEHISEANFLNDLLHEEIDDLKGKLHSDLGDTLQPLIGERVEIQLGESIFGTDPWHLTHHFAARENKASSEQNAEAELDIQKSISIKYMDHKVDTIFAGSDTVNSNGVLSPLQMAGLEPSPDSNLDSYQTPITEGGEPPTLTGDEFVELFGLFDEYNCMVADGEERLNGLNAM